MTRRHSLVVLRACRPPQRSLLPWAAAGALALAVQAAWAQPSEEEDLALAYGDKTSVSIATGSQLPVRRAPAVASVITSEDIAAIGATDLDEVLETVPGLHVARATQGYSPVYVIRGINLGFNPQVLVLINGIPQTTVYTGNRGGAWGGFPLENVARIEVIRGPGSALYGAEAFAGVINIITKTAQDIEGTQVGARAGSFGSGDVWMLHGGQWGAATVAAYLRRGHTDGARSTVQADGQTGWDGVLGTHASHAPGPVNNQRDFIDGSLDVSLDKWRWRVGYRSRDRMGSGTGVASALDPTGESSSENINTDLTYEDRDIAPDWAATVQLSYMHYKEFSDLTLYPAGAFGGFADGVIGNPYKWEQHGRLSASAFYTGLKSHRIRLGAGMEKEEVYKIRESKNFDPNLVPIGTGSRADVVDVSDTAPFMTPHDRTKRYLYVQDEWAFAADWTLTAGLRQDHYSDFGRTLNPRAALVWDAAYNITAKLLYGTAFRAPSMTELYNINNPVVIGNGQLRPEKMKSWEAAVSWQPVASAQLGVNVFRYHLTDLIRTVDAVYQNTGAQTGQGLEFEAAWEFSETLRLSGNYSQQRSWDDATDADAGNSPRHQVYVRADWQLGGKWSMHPQLNWVGDRHRAPGDTRDALKGYETVDVTLRMRGDARGWEFAASVRNLFDDDVREPTPYDRTAGQPFISLPDDFPLPGRAFYVQATYKF